MAAAVAVEVEVVVVVLLLQAGVGIEVLREDVQPAVTGWCGGAVGREMVARWIGADELCASWIAVPPSEHVAMLRTSLRRSLQAATNNPVHSAPARAHKTASLQDPPHL